MSTNQTEPYSVEVWPSPKGDGTFGWAIRKHGKLLERSDRMFRSQQQALESGQDAVQRTLSGASESVPTRGRR